MTLVNTPKAGKEKEGAGSGTSETGKRIWRAPTQPSQPGPRHPCGKTPGRAHVVEIHFARDTEMGHRARRSSTTRRGLRDNSAGPVRAPSQPPGYNSPEQPRHAEYARHRTGHSPVGRFGFAQCPAGSEPLIKTPFSLQPWYATTSEGQYRSVSPQRRRSE